MAVFWVVAPCSLVEVYRRFRGTCCLHITQSNVSYHTKFVAIFVIYLHTIYYMPSCSG
jgi:hypothetical protein